MSQIGKLQTWKIPADKLENWRRLNPDVAKNEATDCVINSLHFLGVIENRDFASVLSNYANYKKSTDESEILKIMLDNFQSDDEFKVYHKIGKPTASELYKQLKNNTYTIAMFTRINTTGHAVIITKQNDIIYILDPQQETHYCGMPEYKKWVKDQKYSDVKFLIKQRIKRKRDSTTKKLRKPKSPGNLTKKPRLGNTSSSSSKKSAISTNTSISTLSSSTPKKRTGTKKILTSTSTLTSKSR